MPGHGDTLKGLDLLLGDVCRELGFCNRLTGAELLPPGGTLNSTEFAEAVVRAENMNPEYEPKWMRQIGDRFEARFGASISLPG